MTEPRIELGLDIGLTRLTAAIRSGRDEPRVFMLGSGTAQVDIAALTASYDDHSPAGIPWRDVLAEQSGSPGATPFQAGLSVLADAVRWGQDKLLTPVTAIALVVPTGWSPRSLRGFQDAVRTALPSATRLVAKAEAVATAFTMREGVMDGDLLAVVDIGGATFEASVLRAEGARLLLAGPVVSRRGIAGDAVDQLIMSQAIRSIGVRTAPTGPDSTDPHRLAATTELRLSCRWAKESLAERQSTSISVSSGDASGALTLTTEDLASLCAPIASPVLEAIREAIESAQITTSQLRALLLTGGSARLAPLRRAVTEAFDTRVVVSSMPEADAAMGATLVGGLGVADTVPRSSLNALAEAPSDGKADHGRTIEEAPAVAPPPPPRSAVDGSPRRRRMAAILAAVFIVVLGGVAYFAFTHFHDSSGPSATKSPTISPTTTAPRTSPSTSKSPPPPPRETPIFPISPKSIVVSLARGRTAKIVAVSTTGAHNKVLIPKASKGSPQPRSPNIAPNRKSLVYLMARKNGQPGIPWVAAIRPSQPSSIVTRRLFPPTNAGPCAATTRPSFSPDSSRLAVMCVARAGHPSGLYVVDAQNGTHPRLVYAASRAAPRLDLHSNPSWVGPHAIAFQARSGSGPDEIWTIDVSAAPPPRPALQTSGISGWNSHTDWSAMGGLLMLNQRTVTHAGHRIARTVVLNRTRNSSRFVEVPKTLGAKAPCWGPSGDVIAFLRNRHLVTMHLNGTAVHVLKLGFAGNPLEPAWDSK